MKITVITVCRNSAATLQDTLESVLAQSWTGYEYLVVDGGSTDGTLEMLQDVEGRFHGRLKWISEPDNGIYDAMNKGVRMSSGDVVGFLNADDYYQDNGVLETIAGAFAQHGTDAVHGNLHYINAARKVVRTVFMRTGGSSTAGLRAILRNTRQNRQAFRKNSLPCPWHYGVTRLLSKAGTTGNPVRYFFQTR